MLSFKRCDNKNYVIYVTDGDSDMVRAGSQRTVPSFHEHFTCYAQLWHLSRESIKPSRSAHLDQETHQFLVRPISSRNKNVNAHTYELKITAYRVVRKMDQKMRLCVSYLYYLYSVLRVRPPKLCASFFCWGKKRKNKRGRQHHDNFCILFYSGSESVVDGRIVEESWLKIYRKH